MAELAVRAADALELEVAGIDILFDEEGYRICEANSAPGFQGLERACAIDVPGAIFDWIEASQPSQARPLRAMTGGRSEERRGGEEGVRKGRSRGAPVQ